MAVMEGTQRLKTLEAEYDFTKDAGAVGTITLRSPAGDGHGNDLPAGSVITGGYIDVEVAVTSGGAATTTLTAEGAGDIASALAIAALTTGRKSIVPVGTGATAVKTSVRRSITMTVAVAALTAGKFRLVLFYK